MYKIIVLLLFISLTFRQCAYGQEQVLQLPTQGLFKGLNTKVSSHRIGDDFFQDMRNVWVDSDVGIKTRGGFVLLNQVSDNQPFRHLAMGIDMQRGNSYIVGVSSTSIIYRGTSSSSDIYTLISTASLTTEYWSVMYSSYMYLGNATDGTWRLWWNIDNGTVNILHCGAMVCANYGIVAWNKVIWANIPKSSATANTDINGRSLLMYSDIGDAELRIGDQYIYIDMVSKNEITGLFLLNDNLYVTKENAIYKMVGLDDKDTTNDGYIKVVEGIGCLRGQTIAINRRVAYFLSYRGVEAFDGLNIELLSETIESDVDNTIKNVSLRLPVGYIINERYWLSTDEKSYVLDTMGNWVIHSSITARSFLFIETGGFKNNYLFGSAQNNGKLYKLDNNIVKDDGGVILTYVKTKDFDFGSSINDKKFGELWVIFESTTAYSNATVEYYINKSTTPAISELVSLSALGVPNNRRPIAVCIKKKEERFRYISFKVSNFTELYNLIFQYTFEPKGYR